MSKPKFYRDVEPYNDDDGGDCLMTVEDFVLNCECNAFTDYDGFGEWSDGKQVAEGHVYASDYRRLNKPDWATHVVWYNR